MPGMWPLSSMQHFPFHVASRDLEGRLTRLGRLDHSKACEISGSHLAPQRADLEIAANQLAMADPQLATSNPKF
jgi:hypothetical protein